ncbi:MAG: lysine--tRNA ligase [Candidatus Adiutrix intracellularis]|jgi:lysyl-tRNA synthetase class 2|nr:lysine--tRNA ligase [Candidatus Adiutrix intracellularis]
MANHAVQTTPETPVADIYTDEENSPFIQARFNKARELAENGRNLYPNTFRPTHKIAGLRCNFGEMTPTQLETLEDVFTLAGRIMARRDYGKSVFFDFADSSGRLQAYIRKQAVDEDTFALFKKLDLGDLIGLSGGLFKTKTGELTLLVSRLELVTKCLWPLPEKYHDLHIETRYRQRYIDLIMNEDSRRLFLLRSRIVGALREFMTARNFIEVETPMMHTIPGGAVAKPFETFHHALNRRLYLRIAPELYLKRLLVGGFDRVFEINRCFRNEGLSIQHNPEFTIMEFYQSYADFTELMDLTEEMFVFVAEKTIGSTNLTYQGTPINFRPPWPRVRFDRAVVEIGGAPENILSSPSAALSYLKSLGGEKADTDIPGKILAKIFDLQVEPKLVNPTFVTYYPADISPLARRNGKEPNLTDRFELFVSGRELANAFSELNDPLDQRERFRRQAAERAAGDEEGMHMDEDYVRALMYGMPPAAGEGVGIDRLVMLLANAPAIKDVILFPHLKPTAG